MTILKFMLSAIVVAAIGMAEEMEIGCARPILFPLQQANKNRTGPG